MIREPPGPGVQWSRGPGVHTVTGQKRETPGPGRKGEKREGEEEGGGEGGRTSKQPEPSPGGEEQYLCFLDKGGFPTWNVADTC